MSEQHTPMPWSTGEAIGDLMFPILAQFGPLTVCPANANSLGDRDFIIRACNAHADLVAALKDAADDLESLIDMESDARAYVVSRARAALAKAEEQP